MRGLVDRSANGDEGRTRVWERIWARSTRPIKPEDPHSPAKIVADQSQGEGPDTKMNWPAPGVSTCTPFAPSNACSVKRVPRQTRACLRAGSLMLLLQPVADDRHFK